jgi:hypothetical protein
MFRSLPSWAMPKGPLGVFWKPEVLSAKEALIEARSPSKVMPPLAVTKVQVASALASQLGTCPAASAAVRETRLMEKRLLVAVMVRPPVMLRRFQWVLTMPAASLTSHSKTAPDSQVVLPALRVPGEFLGARAVRRERP